MKIQDVELQTGLDRATIRFYEKEEILQPKRSENGYRDYTDADIDLLLKVKLLRKLGVSIPTIKHLQEGSADLTDILTQQIQLIEQKIQDNTAAEGVCKQIINDNVQYSSLNSRFYLDKLAAPHANQDFQEETNSEIHPVRRYIARVIDLAVIQALLSVILIMIVRIRPYIDAPIATLAPILVYILSLPISALMLHLLGTTPGKWLMGIRLEDPNGGKLSFRSALGREINVLIAGCGLHIPIFKQIRLFISFRDVSNGEKTEWEVDAEIQYNNVGISRILLTVITAVLAIALNYSATLDAAFPKYRSNNLTMDQFVSNYRDYEKQFQNDNTMILQQDGTWKERTDYSVEIMQIGDPNHVRQNFQYTFNEKGGIETISFSDTWEDLGLNTVLPDYCYTALITAVASQKGVNLKELQELEQAVTEDFGELLEAGGHVNGEFSIQNVFFTWNVEMADGEFLYMEDLGGVLVEHSNRKDQDAKIPYTLEFVITIE